MTGVRPPDVRDQIRLYLRARVALIVLVTVEERRALQVLDEVRKSRDPASDLIAWDIADRFSSKNGATLPDAGDPVAALDKIRDRAAKEPQRRDLYVLKDFHEFWSKDPRVRRKVRNLAQQLIYTGSSLVVTTPVRAVPQELRDEAVVIEMPAVAHGSLPDGSMSRTRAARPRAIRERTVPAGTCRTSAISA